MIRAPKLTFSEELANVITHGVMCVITLFFIPFASVYAYIHANVIGAISIAIYMISIFLMFLISTLYHSMSYESKHKQIFRLLDHIFIYVAIAGSYTPVALLLIHGWLGILIIVIQWLIVLCGIFYKIFSRKSNSKIGLTLYLIMGWIALMFLPTLIEKGNPIFLLLIVLGGVFYSIGAYFYTKRTMKYHHMLWHIYINIASIMHAIAIVFFIY